MKKVFENALAKGKLVKYQGFRTEKGLYAIGLDCYRKDIYFFKWLNDNIVECCNLSKKARDENKALNEENGKEARNNGKTVCLEGV